MRPVGSTMAKKKVPKTEPDAPKRPQFLGVDIPEFSPEWMEKHFPGGFTVRDEANALVHQAFRAGPIEDLHAGTWSKLLEDDSLSRITDAEMKVLMVSACEKLANLLRLRDANPAAYRVWLMSICTGLISDWDR